MAAQTHRSDSRIIGRRTLDRDHRLLFELLEPGAEVLDVGCGTGSITRGIADRVGPKGLVLGLDNDPENISEGRRLHQGVENLTFRAGNILEAPFDSKFDVVNAARTLQWIADPGLAVRAMTRAAKPGGIIVALDYNHEENTWDPGPPEEFRSFYRGFLEWRSAHGWDNRMGDRLPALMEAAALQEITMSARDEIVRAGEPGCEEACELWPAVIRALGESVVTSGFATAAQLDAAGQAYREWSRTAMKEQRFVLRGVWGRVIK